MVDGGPPRGKSGTWDEFAHRAIGCVRQRVFVGEAANIPKALSDITVATISTINGVPILDKTQRKDRIVGLPSARIVKTIRYGSTRSGILLR
jgi:hypothetical protein